MTTLAPKTWLEHALVAAVTFIAAAIRLYMLLDWPFYGDEAAILFHLNIGTAHLLASFASYLPFMAIHKLFPDDFVMLRLVPLFFGVITIPIVYYIARREIGRFGAAVAILFLTVSHWHIAHSQFVKHYAEQGLFAFIAVYAAYRAIESNSRGHFIVAVVFGVLLAFVRASSLYVNAVIAGYIIMLFLLADLRPEGFVRRRAATLLAVQVFVCVLSYSMKKVLYGEGDELWGHSFLNVLLSAAFYSTVPALAIAAMSGMVGILSRNRLVIMMSAYVFGTIFLLGVTAWLFSAVGGVAFMTIPGTAFLIGWISSREWTRNDLLAKGAALAIVIAALASQGERDFEYFTVANGNRPHQNKVMSYLLENVAEGDTVYESSGMSFQAAYMEARKGRVSIRFNPALGLPAEFNRGNKAWFVFEDIHSTWGLPEPARAWVIDHAELKTAFPAYIGPRSRTVWIYLYEPPPDSTNAEPENQPIG